ncbi:MAG: ABC transporter ATP-binding protein [Acidimicrobiia bacterium]
MSRRAMLTDRRAPADDAPAPTPAGAGPVELAVEVEGVSHFFEKHGRPVEVLHDISLRVRRSEFVSIIGPSGCGKSTLLFMIAGFIRPTRGIVSHGGRPVEGPAPDRGIVFQADAVFPWLTVEKNVEFGLRMGGMPRAERRRIAHRYLSLVGLEGSERLYPKQLSGGMRKRVDVARTFANNPAILLMDESFGSIDVLTKERLQIELLALWEQEKKTALFVTHDVEEAIFLADRVVVMRGSPGRIVEELRVPFERPRDLAIKPTAKFQAMRRELGELMTAERG